MAKNVLIVDDSIFIYEEMRYMLTDSDYKVIGYAKDGQQAIKMYEELKPDVVTMDIIMPGANGLEVSRELLGKWNDAKVIIVSSLAYDETKEQADAIGVCGFVFKPVEKEMLLNALDQAVGEK